MVKGNWERRAELAALRREEEKARKAEKKQAGPKATTAESVLARLRRGGGDNAEGVMVWVLRADAAQHHELVCRSWYRTSFCEAKRCRCAHTASLASSVRGLVYDESLEAELEEAVCEGPLDAASLPAKDLRFVRFIAVGGGRLVFDWARPQAWTVWAEGQALPSLRALSITEDAVGEADAGADGEGEEGGGDEGPAGGGGGGKRRGVAEKAAATASGAVCHLAALATSNRLSSLLLSFLPVRELGCLLSCSPRFKKAVLVDDASRQRRKTAFGLVSGDVSRSRKQEKKKSQKRAFIGSTDKVDAYARGIGR